MRGRAENGVDQVLRVRDVGAEVEEGGDGQALVGDRVQRDAEVEGVEVPPGVVFD